MFRRAFAAAAMVLAAATAFGQTPGPTPADLEFFERKVRPLLISRCYECHSAESKSLKGGLRLDPAGLLAGGDSGPAFVPHQPEDSLLIFAVRFDGLEMPPTGRLSPDEVSTLEEWVRRGAPLPPVDGPPVARAGIDFERGREFWSFRPLRDPTPPAETGRRSAGAIDAFVVAELERRGLSPSPVADRRTLIRRVSFDLTGLPPTPEEVATFVTDPAVDAYERLVDRLLASPHYGERWGRHWLDLARYSDATASWLDSLGQAWLYRDWVVAALNADQGYDDFVRCQLAADQLPGARPADIAALGFLGLSPVYWKELKLDPEVIKGTVAEEWEERIDAVGRTFLGLTVACARCHDHKYDPIAAADYYALAGVFAGTRLTDRPVVPESEYAAVRAARESVAALTKQAAELGSAGSSGSASEQLADLRRRIAEIERSTPNYHSATAHAVDDAAIVVEADGPDATKIDYVPGRPVDLAIQIRGNPSNPGAVVPRRFLEVFDAGEPRLFSHGSGRLDLAEALVADAAPLAARVIVNRVWTHHFGRGLVDTPSDFGTQGSPPSHPDLLEHLASRFVADGWSLKSLHREIVLSATYRQASVVAGQAAADAAAADPDNRWLWRMNRRRLEVETWRDAMLYVTGELDPRIGGPAFEFSRVEEARRSVYGRVDRYALDPMLRLYDFPDPLGHSPSREPTTTPLQQLFVLNGPLLRRQADLLSRRLTSEAPGSVEARVEWGHRLVFGRAADAEELRLASEFLGDGGDPGSWSQYAQALLGSNEFLYVD